MKLKKNLVAESLLVNRVIQMVKLGARLQVIQEEVPGLSKERYSSIYREVTGSNGFCGPMPSTATWFLTWAENAHSSLFMGIYNRALKNLPSYERIDILISSYKLYIETCEHIQNPTLLDINRAWTLTRYCASGILTTMACKTCSGHFVSDGFKRASQFVCHLCLVDSKPGPKISFDRISYKDSVPKELAA